MEYFKELMSNKIVFRVLLILSALFSIGLTGAFMEILKMEFSLWIYAMSYIASVGAVFLAVFIWAISRENALENGQ